MKWDFKSSLPIYQQIVEVLELHIVSGGYPPGSRMPTVRDLALEAGVNPNTMQRALQQLERNGLVFSERTSGRFVTKDEEILRKLRLTLAHEYISQMYTSLQQLGMSQEEIVAAVRDWKRDTAGEETAMG